MPFAVVIRSGTMPSSSQANHWPVRQNPDWISSATNTIPLSWANRLIAGRKPFAGSMKPPSPSSGSMMIAATFSAPTCLLIWSMACAAASGPAFSGPVGQR